MDPPALWQFDQELFRSVHLGMRRAWLDPVVHIVTMSGLGYVQGLAVAWAALRERYGQAAQWGVAVGLGLVCAAIERDLWTLMAFLGVYAMARLVPTRALGWALISLVVSGLVRLAVVPVVGRERPSNFAFADPMEPIFGRTSMPSGHATTTFAVFFMIAWLAGNRAAVAVFGLWALAVGFSRVYVGVHYPLDIVAGAALGLAVASTLVLVERQRTAARETSSNLPEERNLS